MIQLFADNNIPLSDTLLLDGYSWLQSHGIKRADGGDTAAIAPSDARAMLAELLGLVDDGGMGDPEMDMQF